MPVTDTIRYWAVIPAAGIGARMAAGKPKQYLEINDKTILDYSLQKMLTHPAIAGVRLVLAESDQWWNHSQFSGHERVKRVDGGAERCHSVLHALHDLAEAGYQQDQVLVHDAARPCVRHADISRLIELAGNSPDGGLLAAPVSDTMKRSDAEQHVVETIDRRQLWRAFTPQLFRIETLRQALLDALAAGQLVTDEASAMELAGFRPLLVAGSPDNIKVTTPDDLELAAFFLSRQ